ncbi:choice-of-anchor D domain-containing protein [Natronocalculus amylovorans]|uniref:Choice-of-anchor D domain-containing protein n=1 Tax=Natronocalculus amylovorans TaxID=2917812 RepID=A0AAE3K8P0_9EURY|nr:choice-of-anchor D domain-containing protein [Natronocalculus amylovorans]MCL9817512.1 choice-of-anchor D domain-containing protein [Natronocalculus amylovorans]
MRDTNGRTEREQSILGDRFSISTVGGRVLRMCVLIGVLLLAGSVVGGIAATEETVEISNWSELQSIEDDLDGDYILIADLDKNTEDYDAVVGDGDFRPIGPTFTGSFDGNGQTISDLVIDGGSNVGLFSTSEGDIHRLALQDVEIYGDDNHVGGIVGSMDGGSISKSYVTGEVSSSRVGVGGLIGQGTDGEINASYTIVDGSVGIWSVGGLVGDVRSGTLSINESYALGTLSGDDRLGGLVGDVVSGTVNIESVYWDRERSGVTNTAGRVGPSATLSTNNVSGLSSDELKGDAAVTNMDGFDFDATWAVETGDIISHPYLQSTPQDPAPGRENTRFAGGIGTADDPIQIETWEHLHRVSESLDAHFELIGDLDEETDGYEEYVTDPSEGFEPIGSGADPFTGEFDGSGYVIDGLYIDQNGDYVGLFGSVGSTGRLTHVGLDAVNVTGNEYVGGVAGESAGEIDQSWVSGNVTGSVTVGGLVGHTTGTVVESYSVGTVTAESAVGGLVGSTGSSSAVSESYAAGDIEADTEFGGLVGVNDGEVSTSFWNVDVVESGDGAGVNDGTVDATGLSTTEMKGEAAVANMSDDFDFDATWTVRTGHIISYPYLQSTVQEPAPGYDDLRFAGGLGSKDEPLEIDTWEHLHNVRQELDGHFELVGDLDDQTEGYSEYVADRSVGFEPIGNGNDPFTGTFEGHDHEIRDLRIDRSEASNGKDAGLFLYVDGGVISSVGIIDGEITAADGSRGSAATDGSDATDGENGGDAAGLVLVNNDGAVRNSRVTNTIVTAGSGGAGGNGCSTFGQFDGCSGDDDGGLGSAGGDGGDGGDAAGVVLGSIDGAVNNTYLTGSTVTAGSGRNGGHGGDGGDGALPGGDGGDGGTAAGLIEYIDGEDAVITDSYVDDTVITAGSGGRGGPGYDGFQSSPNPGAGGDGGAAAGIVSDISDGTVQNVYIFATNIDAGSGGSGGDGGTQDPNGSPGDDGPVGTIVVENGGTVSASYWSTDTVNQNVSDGGEGLTSAQMRGPTAEDNMNGFDFADTWAAGTNPEEGFLVSLPYLQQNQQVPAPGAESLFADGNGTAENPYQIENWEHLHNIREVLDANYTLSGDLNETAPGYETYVADPTAGFEPIGDDDNAFNGTFNGSGFTISNLEINQPDMNRVGLFAKLDSGSHVEYVTLESVSVEGSSIVGGLVGDNADGTVHDSFVSGSVSGSDSVGGLVGSNRAGIHNSSTDVVITSARGGGLVGYNDNNATIQSSVATGVINGDDETGGLVGWNDGGTIHNSYASGSIDGNENVGGLVGKNGGEIKESYSVGPVDGNSNVGGLVGTSDGGTVTNSYWDVETTQQTESAGGIGLTTLQMTGDRAADNMDGFDFGETWVAGEADSQEGGLTVFYPVLQNNTQEPAPSTSLYDTGEGTVDNPYEIGDWYQLNYIRVSLDSEFVLTGDLDEDSPGYEQIAGADANGGDGFEPIGDTTNKFNGAFDGNDHTISDLVIDQSNSQEIPVGLFGYVGGDGEINNVTLVSASVTGDESQTGFDQDRTGALVGLLEGTVTNSSAEADVVGGDSVGGLVGINDGGTVSESYATGDVDGNNNVGGLVGDNNAGMVSESYATGDVGGRVGVGGLVGGNSGTVSESYATGTVDGETNVGGLVGLDIDGDVPDSYWDTEATGQDDSAGGLGLTTIEMKGADSRLDGFDFQNTWDVVSNENVSYPFLQAIAQEPAPGLEAVEDISVSLADTEIEQGEETSFTVTVSLSESGESEATRLSNLTSSNPANATVDENGTVTGTGVGNVTITGSYGSKEDSAILTVTPGPSVEVDVETQPATSTAGEPLVGPPAVLVTDEFGNPTPGTNVSVTAVNDPDALVSGDLEVETNESGISTFDDLVIETAADYELEFSINDAEDGVNESDTAVSEEFTVEPADPDSFEIETQPNANQTAGESITGLPAVNVTDAFDNSISGLTISATADGPGPVVSGGKADTDGEGVATFDDLVIETAGDYQLNFSIDGEGLEHVTTDDFTVEPADADSVAIVTQPADSTAGESLAGPPTVNVTDEFDNLVDGISVTVSEMGGYTFDNGTTTIETVDGIATFDDLVIETAANYELEFSITDAEDGVVEADDAASDVFTVEPADANSVDIDTQPADSTAGELIVGPPTVNVTDTFNNPIANKKVTATINGSATLDGATEAATNSTGIAVFDQLSNTTADTYELSFALTENNAVNSISDAFEITPAAPDRLAATNVTETAGIEGEITLTLTDEFSNQIPGETISVSDDSNISNLAETAITNESGVAAFSFNETTSGTYTPTFDVAEDDTVTESTTVTIEPAAPINFGIETNGLVHTVSNDFTDQNALNVSVTLSDQFDNLIPNANVTVTDDGIGTMVHPEQEQKTDENATTLFTIQTATPQENLNFTFTELESGENNSAVLEGVDFEPALPQARGSASSYTVTLGTNVTFRASDSIVPTGSNPQYNWTFEDDGTEIENATGLTHTTNFTQPVTLTAILNVTVANETSTDTFTVHVQDRQRPTARLTAPETVAVGESFELTGTESTDNIGIADYEWDFGNGTVVNGPTLNETTGNYTEPGEYDVTLTVTDTSGNTDTNTTTLIAEGANATLSTNTIDFGEIGTNSTTTDSIRISNDGTTALNITDTTVTGTNESAFTIVGNDNPRIRPDESQSLRVAFEPTAVNEKNATLRIMTENNTGPDRFEIAVNGVGIQSNLSAVASSVDFGSVDLATPVEQNVTIENNGTDNATIEAVALLGSDADHFNITTEPSTIVAGNSENITVTFGPQAVGSKSTTLRIETTDGDSARVALSGTGEGPQLNIPSTSRSAGSIGSGTDTTATATLRNYGSQPLNITDFTLTGADSEAFEIVTDVDGLVIAPDTRERVELQFAPDAPGEYTTVLEVAHNDTTMDTAEITFRGTAVSADIDVDQTTLDFGTTEVGQSGFLNLTISNDDNSGAALNITSTSIVGSNSEDFSIENPDRPFTVAAGEERDLQINFTALAAGAREAQLQINSDANQGQTNVWLSNTRSYIVVQEVSNPTVNIDGRNLDEGTDRMLNVSTPSTRASDVTIDELGFTMQRDGDFEMNLINGESAFDNAFDADSDTEIVQYVGIKHLDHLSDDTFADTSLIYRVDTDALSESIDPDDVAIHRYDETSGEYVELDAEFIEERGGQLHYIVETPGFSEFVITATDAEDDTPGTAPSTGGGSGSAPAPSSIDIQVTGESTVEVSGGRAGDTIRINDETTGTNGTFGGQGNIVVNEISVELASTRDFWLTVETFEFGDARANMEETSENGHASVAATFETETGTLSVGYITIRHNLEPEDIVDVHFDFSVNQSYIDTLDIPTEEVSLHRQSDNWTALPTNYIGANESHYRFEANSPGFSSFAIGTGAPVTVVTDATLDESELVAGETATTFVTVENRGEFDANSTIELDADGVVVDSDTVAIPAGETIETTLSFEPAVGEYELSVNGVDVGHLTVVDDAHEQSEDTDTDRGEETRDAEDETDGAIDLRWLFLIAIILVLLAVLWRYRTLLFDSSE